MTILGALAIYLVGLLSPAVTRLIEYTLLAPIRKREAEETTATRRNDEGALIALEKLSELEQLIPERASWRRNRVLSEADESEMQRVVQAHARVLAEYENATFLLDPKLRDALNEVLPVLRYADDLPFRASSGRREGYHPDSVSEITKVTTTYCRQCLSASRRHERFPSRPAALDEYLLAMEDRDEDLTNEFAFEIYEDETAVGDWREAHDLPRSRPSTGD